MESVDLQVLEAARRWAAEGHSLALVTVAHTWGSAPRPAGSWLVLRDDGVTVGSVSGGCVEDDLTARMRDGRLAGAQPFALPYGVTQEEAARYGLPCGGALELVIEPQPDPAQLDQLAARLEMGELVLREIDLLGGSSTLNTAQRGDELQWNGQQLRTVHGPQWRLFIVGAGQISYYLAQMAQALDYDVTICEPREEYGAEWRVPGTRLLTTMPDDAFLALQADARCAVVALTHDPKLDDLVLLEALRSPAFYVGAVGSRLNDARRRERLMQHFDFSPAELQRLHGPVGLPIGSHTPPEIAVAIVAEMTAVRHGAPIARRLASGATSPGASCQTEEAASAE